MLHLIERKWHNHGTYVNDFSTGQLFSFQRNSDRLKQNRTTGRLCSLLFGLDSTNGKIVEHRVLSKR